MDSNRKCSTLPHVLRLATFDAYFGTQLIGLVVKGQEFMLHKPLKLNHTQDMANQQIISRTGIIISQTQAPKQTSYIVASSDG